MTLFTGNINNILQGVSQQPRRDRRPEQLEVEENCLNSITYGTRKRPGCTLHTQELSIADFKTAKKYTYDRGLGYEQYTIAISPTAINVVDLISGEERTVNTIGEGTLSYLADQSGENKDPQEYLKLFTIADTTFITNSTIPVEIAHKTMAPGWQCCLYLKSAKFGRDYQIFIDDNLVSSYTTPSTVALATDHQDKRIGIKAGDSMAMLVDGTTVKPAGTDQEQIAVTTDADTNGFFADSLGTYGVGQQVSLSNAVCEGTPNTIYKISDISPNPNGDDFLFHIVTMDDEPVEVIQEDSAIMNIRPYPTKGSPVALRKWAQDHGVDIYTAVDSSVVVLRGSQEHRIEVTDDDNGSCFKVISDSFSKYTDLPDRCLHGYTVKISGEDTDAENDYYVQFERFDDKKGIGRGLWKECVGFSEYTAFDRSTMPHMLISEADGTFTFKETPWLSKKAGDEDSNPTPSIVGHTIASMGLYQDRLVFLSGENCVTSRTSHHFDLFAESVLATSDEDPIDTASSDNEVTKLEHLIIFNSSLLILSEKAQFIHPGTTPFIADKFALASKSQYSANIVTQPIAAASSVFFCTSFGDFTGVREFKIDEVMGVVSADSITEHVKEYIPGSAEQIVASTDHNTILVRTEQEPSALYVYEWYDLKQVRKQAAWHVWKFPFDISHIAIIKDTLYLWYDNNGITTYASLDLALADSPDIDFPLHLDLYSQIKATENEDTWEVAVNLGTLMGTWDDIAVIGGLNTGVAGAAVAWTINATETGILIAKASLPNCAGTPWFYVGRKYNALITLTNPFVRDKEGKPLSSFKTTLKTMDFNLANTGYLQAEITKENAPTFIKAFSSKIIQSAYLLNSAAPLANAKLHLPIRTDMERCTITLSSDSHLPFNILDIGWSGTYKRKGIRTS